jgi:hypothetical protein
LLHVFDARDLGEVTCFFNLSVRRDRAGKLLGLNETRYAVEVVEHFGIKKARALCLPMTRDLHLRRGDVAGETASGPYSETVGRLMYFMTYTRPDLAQSVGALSRFVSDPRKQHWEAVKKVLGYMEGTTKVGLRVGGVHADVVGYCDADVGPQLDTRRSTTAYVFIRGFGAVFWRSVLQPTVPLSTIEAEYLYMAAAAREALWLKTLLGAYGVRGWHVNAESK